MTVTMEGADRNHLIKGNTFVMYDFIYGYVFNNFFPTGTDRVNSDFVI